MIINGGCPVTSKPATKTSPVAGLLEAQAGCRVEGGVLRVGVRRREGRPGGRGSWVGQVLSPKGRPWIRPGSVVALFLARHGHLQAPMPSVLTRRRPLPLPCAGAHSAGARFPADSIPSQQKLLQSPASQHCGEPNAII